MKKEIQNNCMPWDVGFPACWLGKPRSTIGAIVGQAIMSGATRGFDLQSANDLKNLPVLQGSEYASLKEILISIENEEGFAAYL